MSFLTKNIFLEFLNVLYLSLDTDVSNKMGQLHVIIRND